MMVETDERLESESETDEQPYRYTQRGDHMAHDTGRMGRTRTFRAIESGLLESTHEGRGLTVDDVVRVMTQDYIEGDCEDPEESNRGPMDGPVDITIYEGDAVVAIARHFYDGKGGYRVLKIGADLPKAAPPDPLPCPDVKCMDDAQLFRHSGPGNESAVTFWVSQSGQLWEVHEGNGLTLDRVLASVVDRNKASTLKPTSSNPWDMAIFRGSCLESITRFKDGHYKTILIGEGWIHRGEDDDDRPWTIDDDGHEELPATLLSYTSEGHDADGPAAPDKEEPEAEADPQSYVVRRHRACLIRNDAVALYDAREQILELEQDIRLSLNGQAAPRLEDLLLARRDTGNAAELAAWRLARMILEATEQDSTSWEPCGVRVDCGPNFVVSVTPGTIEIEGRECVSYELDDAIVVVVNDDAGRFENLSTLPTE
jgi:hypothetical protein